MQKPNFFIVGAPKCGTTSLAMWLSSHPQVYFSPIKEPHFFNRDGLTGIDSLEDYESLFDEAQAAHVAIGEGSTHYLFSLEAIPRILEYNAEARFIVCLRNPVEMAPALHGERLKQGREIIFSFEEAWQLQEERKRGLHIPETLKSEPERLQYGEYCKLGHQLSRLYDYVSKDKVLTVLLDDLRRDSKTIYLDVLDFLGLEHPDNIKLPIYNKARTIRFPLVSSLTRKISSYKKRLGIKPSFGFLKIVKSMNMSDGRDSLSPVLKNELSSYFSEDITLLEKLLGRDLSNWKE